MWFRVSLEYRYKTEDIKYFRTDKILVQCDDTQYTFDISYFDVGSDSDYSYPYFYYDEWAALVDGTSKYDGHRTVFDMTDFAQSIINSKNITLRFYDGGKKRDFSVPSSQQTEFKNMWNLYNILKNNPGALDYLI